MFISLGAGSFSESLYESLVEFLNRAVEKCKVGMSFHFDREVPPTREYSPNVRDSTDNEVGFVLSVDATLGIEKAFNVVFPAKNPVAAKEIKDFRFDMLLFALYHIIYRVK